MTRFGRNRQADAVRHFSRFYTRQIGALQEGLLDSPFSLTEARVLYELANRKQPTATELGSDLGLDAGYLSRILRRFEKRKLLSRVASKSDRRQSLLTLTARGRKAFAPLDRRSHRQVSAMLKALSAADQRRLIQAMQTIETLLDPQPENHPPYLLRPHQIGDIGWVIRRHGMLYAEEYGWDETFEAMAADVAAKFIREFDPKYERCWIAERNGENVGAVFLVRQSDDVAKLRLLIVEPSARGLGIGRRLIEECIRFAKLKGYRKITLWTNDILTAARHLYQQADFRLVQAEPHHSFGHDLVGETWELDL